MEKPPIIKGVEGLPAPLSNSAPRAATHAALTPGQRVDYDALRALVQDVARYRQPGATSDHSNFYDENGLPA